MPVSQISFKIILKGRGNGHAVSKDAEEQTHDASAEQTTEETTAPSNNIDTVKKWIYGLLLVIGIAVAWVGATQLAQATYSDDFFSPSFNVWFSTVWMFICYPVYIVGALVFKSESRSWEGVLALHRYICSQGLYEKKMPFFPVKVFSTDL